MKKEFKGKLSPMGPKGASCFLIVPFDVKKIFGTRARVAVKGTINGHPFRSSIMPMRGEHWLCINKQLQAGAKVKPGDVAKFVMEADLGKRTVSTPAILKKALIGNKKAAEFYASLSYTHKKEIALSLDEAKQAETRERRLQKWMAMLVANKRPT